MCERNLRWLQKTHELQLKAFVNSCLCDGDLRLVGCVEFNVPLDTILGHFGDGGVTAASARIIAAASAEASSPAQPYSVCGVE